MAQPAGNEQAPQAGTSLWGVLRQVLFFLMIYSMFFGNPLNKLMGGPSSPQAGSGSTVQQSGGPAHVNLMPLNYEMDMWVYMSESPNGVNWKDTSSLIWFEESIVYDSWESSNTRTKSISIPPTPTLLNNGSLYAHVFFARHGTDPSIFSKPLASKAAILLSVVHPLTKYKTYTVGTVKKNLLAKEDKNAPVIPIETKIVSHWKGNLTISLIQDRSNYPRGAIPVQFTPYFHFDDQGNFYPIVFCNDFWITREHLFPLNDTVKDLQLDLSFEPMSFFKFALYTQMEQSFSMQRDMFGAEEGEDEQIKHMLIDNPPWLLALTFGISTIHMILDFLAFKNDISFWKNKKSMEGLSIRTIYINFVSNVIILLYLLDNDTSWMVLISAVMGVAMEAWKVTRAVNVSLGWIGSIPYPKLTDKSSYVSKTKAFDEDAMRYLSWLAFPIVIGYSVYSLYYEEYKSWYSWIVGTLAGCVYTFGFVMMTPQLFINYKLKSVAHLPWRTFVYKAINTFIDDLFAFIIRMPTLHRLRVFRDDIIFVIYLYQRWIYRVDKNRVETADGEAGDSVDIAEIQAQQAADAASKSSESKKND